MACWLALAVCVPWTVVRLTGWLPPWPSAPLLAFTPWVIAVAGVALMLAARAGRRLPAALSLACAVALAVVVLPRAVGAADHRSGPLLRVMSANLRIGGADPGTVVRLVREHQVDVLFLEEYTGHAETALTRAGLATLLPHRVADAEPEAIGIAVWSRLPLADARAGAPRGRFAEASATVQPPGAPPVALHAVHPCAPYLPSHQDCWRRDLDAQPRPTPHGPIRLLAGDFNATLDHPPLRRLLAAGYRDAADSTGRALSPSWPNDLVPVVPIDHLLVDRRAGVRALSGHDVPNSDHRALLATLVLPAA